MTKPIDAHLHQDRRLNIPTGEMEPFVPDADRAPLRVEYERRKVSATVAPTPFYDPERKRKP